MSDLILHFVVSDALMISRIEFCSEIIEIEMLRFQFDLQDTGTACQIDLLLLALI